MNYSVGFYAAWVVAVIGVIAGILAGASQAPWHPSWLTSDIAATAGLISAACVGLAALLPQIGRSPAAREATYLKAATQGILPDDLEKKFPSGTVTLTQPGGTTSASPRRPLDTV